MGAVFSPETPVDFYQYTSAPGVVSQKIAFFIITAVRTSNLAVFMSLIFYSLRLCVPHLWLPHCAPSLYF
jgi:hypothetical protein